MAACFSIYNQCFLANSCLGHLKSLKEIGSEDFAIRFKVPENVLYEFDDVIRGTLKFESKDVEDWIILKDNGIPTYNFAVVIDDHYMEISHVFRGEEHITKYT